jgi:hypothetical protein
MSLSLMLSMVVLGQFATPREARPDDGGTATLIVVASGRSEEGANEFLVLEAAGNTVSWSFIEAKGFTENGVDPEGVVVQKGTVRGDAKLLKSAYRSTLGEITDAAPPQRRKQPTFRRKQQRIPRYFSLIFIDSAGVKTCQLWSGEQQRRLVDGDDLKAVFSEVRKKVFGVGYMMPDLLQVGRNPDLAEPRVHIVEGEAPPPPEPLPGEADKRDGE